MKTKTKYFLGALLLAVIMVVGIFAFTQQTILSESNYVQAPQFGFLKCDATGSIQPSSVFSATGEKTVGCNEVGQTSSCQLVLKVPSYSWYQSNARITVIDNAGNIKFQQRFNDFFGSSAKDKVVPETLVPGTYLNPVMYQIKIEYQDVLLRWKLDDRPIQYYYNYQPFVIKRFDSFSSTNGQAITQIGKTSCSIGSNEKTDVVKSASFSLEGLKGSPSTLEPNEAYTYFTRHVTVPNFATGTDVANAYCVPTNNGGQLYEIETVTTNEASYKVVSPSFSTPLKFVACCNGDSLPGKVCRNNVYVDIASAKCSATKPCPNDQFQRDLSDPLGKTAIRYTCQSGKCAPDTKKVDCTLNQQCDAGFICVGFKCIETCVGCNTNNTCGNDICESWESKSTCAKDCDVTKACNAWYESPYESKSCGFWCSIGLQDETTETGCRNNLWIYLLIGGIVFVGLVYVLSMPKKPMIKYIKRKAKVN